MVHNLSYALLVGSPMRRRFTKIELALFIALNTNVYFKADKHYFIYFFADKRLSTFDINDLMEAFRIKRNLE